MISKATISRSIFALRQLRNTIPALSDAITVAMQREIDEAIFELQNELMARGPNLEGTMINTLD